MIAFVFKEGGLVLEGSDGPFVENVASLSYAGGSDPPDLSQETLKLCVCINSGKLFAVPAPFTCDQANEDENPCVD